MHLNSLEHGEFNAMSWADFRQPKLKCILLVTLAISFLRNFLEKEWCATGSANLPWPTSCGLDLAYPWWWFCWAKKRVLPKKNKRDPLSRPEKDRLTIPTSVSCLRIIYQTTNTTAGLNEINFSKVHYLISQLTAWMRLLRKYDWWHAVTLSLSFPLFLPNNEEKVGRGDQLCDPLTAHNSG